MSRGLTSRQHCRLFLEGREVPFQTAMIHSKIGEPTVANIDLVPFPIIKYIRPRTQVHVFVKDTLTFGDARYYLAFEGEVSGRSFRKAQDNRSVGVSAMDYTSYLEDSKNYYMNPNFLVGKVGDTVTLGAPPPDQTVKAEAGKVVNTPASSNTPMANILLSQLDSNGNVDLTAGIVQAVEQLGFSNAFNNLAYSRLRILDRFASYDASELGKFLSTIKLDDFMQCFMGQMGGEESTREVLTRVLALVFHDLVSIPFPSLVPGDTTSTFALSQFLVVPDAFTIPPPKCNVFFPNQIIDYQFNEDFRSTPTRYSARFGFVFPTANSVATPTYPVQYYPPSFSDYMFGKHTITPAQGMSLQGPSALINYPNGNSFASVFFGSKAATSAVGVASPVWLTLRESDFMTNEESIRGIFLAQDTFTPNYAALVRGASGPALTSFLNSVGTYQYFRKRYGSRACGAQVRFNPFVVPGFNGLFLDSSEADQSFIAKIQSVTHTLTNYGGNTQVELGYGRDYDETDYLTGNIGDPPVPPWLDPDTFGNTNTSDFAKETTYLKGVKAIDQDEQAFRAALIKSKQPVVSYVNLSNFYQPLLGVDAITGSPTSMFLSTMRGATQYLLSQFTNLDGNIQAQEELVRSYVMRPMIDMPTAFEYLGASTNSFNTKGQPAIPDEWATFSSDSRITTKLADRFDGIGFADQGVLQVRRAIIDKYRAQLQARRVLRG